MAWRHWKTIGGVAAAGFAVVELIFPVFVPWVQDRVEDRWGDPRVTLDVSRPPQVTDDQGMAVDSAAVVWLDRERPPSNVDPPTTCDNWPGWAPSQEAVDVGTTTLVLTLQSTRKAAVSIHGFGFEVTGRRPAPAPGAYAFCEVTGGADSSPLQMEVNLDQDPPQVHWIENGGTIPPPVLTLEENESEVIWLRVWTTTCDCSWRGILSMVVDGEPEKETIDDDGQPFRTVAGSEELLLWEHIDGEWRIDERDQPLTPCNFARFSGAFSAANACAPPPNS